MTKKLKLDPSQLHFLALGGSSEFGMNLNLYATEGQWLAVDCGIGFADWRLPGVDITLPDPAFIAERRKDLSALIITHAHEDHVGAVAYLWPELRCPIYCTPYTAAVLEKKFSENPACKGAEINIVKPGDTIETGPFTVQFVHVTHSIPDATSLIIETKAGRVVHSGDWNIDPTPVINGPTDEAAFKAAGKKGVMAYIGDSTNALTAGRSGSEQEVFDGLDALMEEHKTGRILVTIFSTNISRIQSIVRVAHKHGRRVVLAGYSLRKNTESARECGYLNDLPPLLSEDDAEQTPRDKLVIIAVGSQGQYNSALAKIVRGDNPRLKVQKDDVFVFSSRIIPGNEKDIFNITNMLSADGVHILTPHRSPYKIHVSGHPCRDEIRDMLGWLKPKTLVSVHGERAMLERQAAVAREAGVGNVLIPLNGGIVKLGPDEPQIVGQVETGVLAVEPKRILAADHTGIVERRKVQFTGAVQISLVLDDRGDLLADPHLTLLGLIDPDVPEDVEFEQDIMAEIEDILAGMSRKDRQNDHAVHEEVRIGVRRLIHMALGMKPKATVHVTRV